MSDGRGYSKLLVVVLATALVVTSLLAGIEFVSPNHSYTTITTPSATTTTKTVTSPAPNGSSQRVTEDVIIQAEALNEICVIQDTTTTSTVFVEAVTTISSTGTELSTISTTTETLSAIGTTTVYQNVTIISGSSTCTEINPHYNVTQSLSCPPCA